MAVLVELSNLQLELREIWRCSDKGKADACALSNVTHFSKCLASTLSSVVVQRVFYVDTKYLEKIWVDGCQKSACLVYFVVMLMQHKDIFVFSGFMLDY